MDKLLNHKFDSDEEDEDYIPDEGNIDLVMIYLRKR